ncbi:MAG: SDR family NAD(P)-dependent oxidoreductase [Spirulinaceae cyanobacterium SM2_1_0]|nr:SDR family NAD(P)-dependent oxidoreductase [Spirulinaceae cyanobacterium SM2_1_0]
MTAIELAKSGFRTFATMRESEARNRPAADALRDLASNHQLPLTVIELDVRTPESVKQGVEAAAAAGHLAVVVNNAGISIPGSIELHTEEQVRAQLETNLLGYHRVARAVLPQMRERQQGLIVQVSSGLGRIVFPTQGWYAAMKFAVEGMSEALAYELAPFGVELTIVQPTQYPTQFLANARRYFAAMLSEADDARKRDYEAQISLTQFGLQDEPGADPRDVALAIRELALMRVGTRPLRRVVSPNPEALQGINTDLGAVQDDVFNGTPFAEWRAAVTD